MTKNEKSNPFEFVTAVSQTKDKNMIKGRESEYNSFLTNRALSYHVDSLLYANEMNRLHDDLTPRMEFDFYLNSLRPRKRFAKWGKAGPTLEDLEVVMNHFRCNKRVAEQYYDILDHDDIVLLKQKQEKGG